MLPVSQTRIRAVLIVSTLIGSWLGMQAIHEGGHVIGAWLTGARIVRVVLNPLTISRTDLGLNPNPLFVVWAGPIFGSVAPLALWIGASAARMPGAFVLRFFAGFCLLANGLYIGIGSFEGIGDCGEMLRHGSSRWQLWLFCAIASPIGLALWDKQGAHFGIGSGPSAPLRYDVAYGTLLACLGLLTLGFTIGGW